LSKKCVYGQPQGQTEVTDLQNNTQIKKKNGLHKGYKSSESQINKRLILVDNV